MRKRLNLARVNAGLTAEEAAKRLECTAEELLSWEAGTSVPGLKDIPKLAQLYRVTNDWLLTGNMPSASVAQVTENLTNRFFDENKMYTYIGAYANAKGYYSVKKCMAFAREKHNGQFRKERGGEPVPYIYHPLLVTCHALALGLEEEDLLCTCLLHDVCEDCGVAPEDLPANETVQEAVRLLTKSPDFDKSPEMERMYFGGIGENRIAIIVKLLDRCHNISGMATCFGEEKMASYILETETYLLPMINRAKGRFPEYSNQFFLIHYHMVSVIETLKHYMSMKSDTGRRGQYSEKIAHMMNLP